MNFNTDTAKSQVEYRPDIDGLRGLAIISVVLYHIFPAWFKSGFIGVDIFFVISGYLITCIVVGSLDTDSFVIPPYK